MKAILKLFLLLLLVNGNAQAQSANDFYDKAVQFEEAGNYNSAINEIDKGLLLSPANENLNLMKVQLLYNSGSKQQALELIESFAAVNPNNELMVNTYSTLLYNMGDKQKAYNVLEDFLNKNKSKDVYITLSSMYEAGELFDKAAAAFAPLAQTMPDNMEAQYRYAELLLEAGNNAEAEAVTTKALKNEPDNEHLLFELANALALQKKNTQALDVLQKLIDKYPAEANYKARAILYRTMGQEDKAYADCLAMLKINDCSLDAYSFLLQYEFTNGLFDNIVTHGNKVLACSPEVEPLLLPLLFPSYYFIGQDAKGEVVLDKYLATKPNEAAPYFVKGASLIKQQKYKEAMPYLEKSLGMPNIKPEEAQVVNTMRVGIWLVTEQYDALADYSGSLSKSAVAAGSNASQKLPGNFSVDPGGTSKKATVTVTFNKETVQVTCSISLPVDTVDMLKERYDIRLF